MGSARLSTTRRRGPILPARLIPYEHASLILTAGPVTPKGDFASYADGSEDVAAGPRLAPLLNRLHEYASPGPEACPSPSPLSVEEVVSPPEEG
jgi:hypothetical protein